MTDGAAGPTGGPNEALHVTVILPVRNRADTIRRAIDSVLGQTHHHLELIVVDDASTDATADVVRSIDDERVQLMQLPERRGASGARNAALDRCPNVLVAFQDSDDWWHPRKLELQLRAMGDLRSAGKSVPVIGCTHDYLDGDPVVSDISTPLATTHSALAVLVSCCVGAGTPKLLIDRSGRLDCRFDEQLPVAEDRDFVYRLLADGEEFGVVDAPLVTVERGRTDHQSDSRRALEGYLRLVDKYASSLSDVDHFRSWYEYLAMNEALSLRDRRLAGHLRESLRSAGGPSVTWEYGLGYLLGRSGLVIARRLGLSPSWPGRCDGV